MGLFTKKWESPDYQKRLKGVEKLKDQDILIKLASQDPSLEVRLAAIEKINDSLFLAQLCNALNEYRIWWAAVPRIGVNGILISLVIATTNSGLAAVVMSELKDLHDEAVFQAILDNAATDTAANGALERVQSEEALCQAALSHRYTSVRRQAAGRIKPDQVLNRVALTDTEPSVREEAAKRVEDQPTLTRLAMTDKNADVRSAAVARVNDKAVLYQVMIDKAKEAPHAAAAERYIELPAEGDEDRALEKIALEGGRYDHTRTAAVDRIKSQAALKRIYQDSKSDEDVRIAALKRINDRALLERVASNPKPLYYRHFCVAFMALPCADENIAKLVEGLLSNTGTWKSRKDCAVQLSELLQQNPDAAKLLWRRVAATADQPHEDTSRHEDNGVTYSKPSDCTHDDYMRHTDIGVGAPFPPYPFGAE